MSSHFLKTKGISRNLTYQFRDYRSEEKTRTTNRFLSGSIFMTKNEPKQPLIEQGQLSSSDIPVSCGVGLAPEWVDVYERAQGDIQNLQAGMENLKRVQAERLKITFGDAKIQAKDREIKILTTQITAQIKSAEDVIKSIGRDSDDCQANAAKTLAK